MKKEELITKAEFARRIGTRIQKGDPMSRAWATKFFKKHPDLLTEDGKVKYNESVKRYKSTQDATRNPQRLKSAEKRKEKKAVKPVPEKQQKKIDPVNEDQLDDDIFSAVIGRINFEELDGLSTEEIGERTQKAQLVRAEFDAKMSELRFYKELGELIHIEDVERVNSRIAAAVRAALLGIPAKLSPALEGLPVDKINDELQEEVNTILEQLSSLKYTPEEELQSA